MTPSYFLNIYKQKGMTSFDVIRKLRKILNIKKIGHSGTLDPLAQGVLQVAVGNSSRLLEYLDDDKEYIADIKFGCISTTLDEEGEKTFIKKPEFDKSELLDTLGLFEGKISQIPPAYSAIKVGGKKLCDIARKNMQMPEIKPRNVEIYKISLIEFNACDCAKIRVSCSKGTYIRSLVRDIGDKLGCGAYMSDLVRVRAGNFKADDSRVVSNDIANYAINPVDVLNLNRIDLTKAQYDRVINGNPIEYCAPGVNDKKFMLIFNNSLVSIANLSDNILKMEKVFKSES